MNFSKVNDLNKMKIIMVTGSYPPDACGVGDYTFHLCNALAKKGLIIEVLKEKSWNINTLFHLIKKIHSIQPSIVHIQYPTTGYGKSLIPHMLSLSIPSVITIHELSQVHILRKFSFYLFTLRSTHIVFTTESERRYACNMAPWIKHKCSIIPIGSNIPTVFSQKAKDITEIIFFGLIRPKRGLEEVTRLAYLIKKHSLNLKIRIIGKVQEGRKEYFENLRKELLNLPVIIDLNLSDDAVAEILAKSHIAYLPYPDGATTRRTSLLAALSNGVVVITTKGTDTPSELDHIVMYAKTPEEALQYILNLINNRDIINLFSAKGRKYAEKFRWDHIAEMHIEVYKKFCR